MINVTKSYLPDSKKYNKYLDSIYKNNILTNNGPLVKELEEKLANYLYVKNLILVSNGTLALQIAYKLLKLKGEVITTPFSFVATISSLLWEQLNPKFVDIESRNLNIGANSIEGAITNNTSAIVPVHVFGNVCSVEKIDHIANMHNLKVIYDAAHTFGVKYKNESVLKNGDVSILSFHASKIFHTIEGGALIIRDDDLYQKAKEMINFGYDNGEIKSIGINAKMNEFQAAMGLCILDDIDMIINKNEYIAKYYKQKLGDYIKIPSQASNATSNFSYFPVIFKNEQELLDVQKELNILDIYPRRYFYPSLHNLSYFNYSKADFPISNSIAQRILCLPLYSDLPIQIQNTIIKIILQIIK